MGDIEGFIQLIPGSYKSIKAVNIMGADKIYLKSDCINGSIVNGIRHPILYSFALNKRPGHNIYSEQRIEVFKKLNKSVLSHSTEDDDHKPVDFIRETITFTGQLTER